MAHIEIILDLHKKTAIASDLLTKIEERTYPTNLQSDVVQAKTELETALEDAAEDLKNANSAAIALVDQNI